jgi:hypothetical protein
MGDEIKKSNGRIVTVKKLMEQLSMCQPEKEVLLAGEWGDGAFMFRKPVVGEWEEGVMLYIKKLNKESLKE